MIGWTFSLSTHLEAQLTTRNDWCRLGRHLIFHLHNNEVLSSREKIKKPYIRSPQALISPWSGYSRVLPNVFQSDQNLDPAILIKRPNSQIQRHCRHSATMFNVQSSNIGLIKRRFLLIVDVFFIWGEFVLMLAPARLCKCLAKKIRFPVRSIMMTRQFLCSTNGNRNCAS